jgi:hypothetical protein
MHIYDFAYGFNIFNDSAFSKLTDKSVKNENLIYLENSKPLSFGKYKDRGIAVEGNDVKLLNTHEINSKGCGDPS